VVGRGRREEERKEAQLTRDFKQKTKVEQLRRNRIEIMTYRIIETQQGRGLHARKRTRESGSRRGRKGDFGFPASALRCTQWDCRHWILAVPLGLGARLAFQLQPWQGFPMLLVSQQRPPIPARWSPRTEASHHLSLPSRLRV
jgi:hypothetical protein